MTPHYIAPFPPTHSSLSSGTATPVNHSLNPSPPHPTYAAPAPNDAYTPVESLEIVSRMGVKKANMRLDKTFFSAVSAGMILAFACATLISTNAAPWYQENAPGLIRTISALVFPYGLVIVHMTGTDLCTGSFMYTTVAAIHGRISVPRMLRHWCITFSGNLAGSLFVCGVIIDYGGVFDSKLYREEALTYAHRKQVTSEWYQIFLRGIGANCLVCTACYLGCSGRDFVSKVVGLWWPTFAFASLGFDHLVANMFIIPNAILQGSSTITVELYIWKGLVPALFGNMIGGSVFVGSLYYYLHLQGHSDVAINGLYFEAAEPAQNQSRVDFWWKRNNRGRKKGDEEV